MKKSLVLLLLLVAAVALAQQPAPPAQAGAGTSQPAAGATPPPTTGPKITDANEYNAYLAAVNTPDPAQRAAALEAFLQTYPNTAVKEQVIETLLRTYQQLIVADPQQYTQKAMDTAQRLLQVNPNNISGLVVLSYYDRVLAQQGGPKADQLLQQAREFGERGLKQLGTQSKPDGYSDEQWTKLKQDFRIIFLGSVGHAALQARDYPTAQQSLKEVVASDPNNFTNVYLLALAYLEPMPPDTQGLFWIARAVALAPPQMTPTQKETIEKYGQSKYVRFHGSDEGWPQLLAMAKTNSAPPANFSIKPAPSPSEQASLMLQKNTPEQMEFAEWQFILTSGNQQAADQVWNAIKGKPIRMVAQVISVSGTTLQLAASADDIAQNKPDVELTVTAAPAPGRAPRPGAQITIQGVPSSYTSNPFLVRMGDGQLISRVEAPAEPRRSRP